MDLEPATDKLVQHCWEDATYGGPMAWQNDTILQLIARIRQEQAEVERLREALNEAPMRALGHTHGAFSRWCMEQPPARRCGMGEFYPHGSPEAEAWKAAVAQQADAKDRRIAALEADLARVAGERDSLHEAHEQIVQRLEGASRRLQVGGTMAWVHVVDEIAQRAEAAEAQVAHLKSSLDAGRALRDQVVIDRDEAHAQVASLVDLLKEWLYWPAHTEGMAGWHQNGDLLRWEQMEVVQATSEALANLPQSAARLLAADEACEAIHRLVKDREPGAYGVADDVMAELDDWLRATAPAEVGEHGH